MITLGIDNTFGSVILEEIAKIGFSEIDDFEQFKLFKAFNNFKNENKNPLINILCQYDSKSKMTIEDFIWLTKVINLIEDGHIWMSMLSVDNYAFPDKELKKNLENITSRHRNISIDTKNKHNSDGLYQFEGNLAFRRLYLTEDKIPSELETMMLKDFSGTIEFGTQNASKTAMSLFGSNITGDESVLLRVPYKSELPPVIAFLHCDKKLNL